MTRTVALPTGASGAGSERPFICDRSGICAVARPGRPARVSASTPPHTHAIDPDIDGRIIARTLRRAAA
jgi:hypothetical protein